MKRLLALTLLLAVAGTLFAEVTFTPNGMAQYRLRLKIFQQDTSGTDNKSMIYRNMIAYYVGTGVKVNDMVTFGFQVGNNSTTTEEAYFMMQKATPVWMSQAWAKLDPGFVNLTFGVLPVAGNGTLDLIERSLNSGSYAKAAQVSWPVGTNASLEGIKIGAPILKEDFKLGVELTQAIITNRTQSMAKEPVSNPSCLMLLLNLPMSVQAFSVTPEIVAILNRDVNSHTETSDNEIGVGFSAGYKVNDMISVSARAALASHANSNTYKDYVDTSAAPDTTFDVDQFDYMGILAGAGAAINVGPGKLNIDFNYSTNENKKTEESSLVSYIFLDVKYGFCMLEDAKKNITIMPRFRYYLDQYESGDCAEYWPEIIFIGKF